jgi:hypothetical protein
VQLLSRSIVIQSFGARQHDARTHGEVTGSDKIDATRNKIALRYGPLIYNIEKVDQDIAKALGMLL